MSTSILSPRWRGRLIGTLFSVASQNHIDLQSEGNLTFGDLLNKVLPNAAHEEQKLINLLIDRFNAARTAEMAAGRSFAPEEDQRLVNQGIAEVKLCIQLYGNLQRIDTEEDFAATKDERHRQEIKRNQRKLFTFLGILSAVVLAAFIYNLPVFREMRLYSKIEKERSYDLTSKYRIEFPDGKHIEEVYLIEVEETGDPTQPVRDYVARFPKGKYVDRAYLTGVGKMDNPLDLLKDYMEHYPQGNNAQLFGAKLDSIWDKETKCYFDSVHNKINPEAEAYMMALLQYMKQHRVYTVYLDLKANVSLKDLNEFPSSSIDEVDHILTTFGEKPLRPNILSLKQNFTETDRDALYKTLQQSVDGFFGKYFDTKLVTVVTDRSQAPDNAPVIEIAYTVKNQMVPYNKSLPNIWVYKVNNMFRSYLLGIVVNIEARFTVPGSKAKLTLKETGEPESEINHISSIEDGYRRMTLSCFEKFSSMIHKALTGKSSLY